MSTVSPVWLTQTSYERLQAELLALRGDGNTEADDREVAGLGDPDPEHLSDTERRRARIRQIQELLARAVVGAEPPDDGVAEPGMVLTVRFDDEAETETFLLGSREGENPGEIEVYSPESPLGTALLGAKQGGERTYGAPGGRAVRVTLVRAVPYGHHHEH